jgi:hypothetical protein
MREPLQYGLGDEATAEIERLVRAARIERGRVVRAAFASAFHWLRGLAGARSRQRAVPGVPVRC